MKFAGDIYLKAPRAAVFAKLRDARFSTLEKLCEALECQPGDLFEYRAGGGAPAAPEPGEPELEQA